MDSFHSLFRIHILLIKLAYKATSIMLLSSCLEAVKIESQHLELEALPLFLLKSPTVMCCPYSVIPYPPPSPGPAGARCDEVTGRPDSLTGTELTWDSCSSSPGLPIYCLL